MSPPWSDPRPYSSFDEPPYGAADYVDSRLTGLQVDPTMPRVTFNAVKAQHDERVTATVAADDGQSCCPTSRARRGC